VAVPVQRQGCAFGTGNTYNISGHDTADVLREAENTQALQRQVLLATVRG
jgi:hypothetical protein